MCARLRLLSLCLFDPPLLLALTDRRCDRRYLQKGLEIHHMGYVLPEDMDVWATVENFDTQGWGRAVQWGHWGTFGQPGSGCYVYVDTQMSLGVTVEILGGESNCGNLPVSQ